MLNRLCRNELPAKAPSFLVIGAQKAGTSALYQYLSRHPHIIGSNPKELNYFSCDKRFSMGDEFYHSHFPKINGGHEITFDASPSYLHNNRAFERIYNYNPEIKMIVLVRDPVERAYSAWNMYRDLYKENREWFFEDWVSYCCAPDSHFERRNEGSLYNFRDFAIEELEYVAANSSSMIECPILTHGLYYQQLSRFLSLFKREQLLIVENKGLRNNTISTLRRIEHFLQVDSHSWADEKLEPVFEGVYSDDIDDELRRILSVYYEINNEQLFELTGERYNWGRR